MEIIPTSCYDCASTWWMWLPGAAAFLFPQVVAKLPKGWDKKVGVFGKIVQVLAGNHSNAKNENTDTAKGAAE